MDNCFICLESDNLIKICKCNFFIHRDCGDELNKYNKKCNICNYTYKYTQNLDVKNIIFTYNKNIVDALFAIYIAFIYIYLLNKINVNLFINIIVQLYIVILVNLYITLLLFHIAWKYIECYDIINKIQNSFLEINNIEVFIIINELNYNISDFFRYIYSHSYITSIIYLIYYYTISFINYLFIKTFDIRNEIIIIKNMFIRDINNRKKNRIEEY